MKSSPFVRRNKLFVQRIKVQVFLFFKTPIYGNFAKGYIMEMNFKYSPPKDGPIILAEDPVFFVIDKPAGLLSVPGRRIDHRDSALERLKKRDPETRCVHRLDMDTSGVMVYARTAESHRALSKQFEIKTVEKSYIADVLGDPSKEAGTIELPLRCDWPNRPLQMVDHELGKRAITHWRIVERQVKPNACRLELVPVTGRSHQLRVHCSELGHEILGDRFYASETGQKMSQRLCLHAAKLSFEHPQTGEKLSFQTECPF